MKNLYLLLCSFLFVAMVSAQSVYPGNNRDGYGGTLGKGSLSVSEDATNYYFTFTKGTGDLNDAVVIYITTKTGGYNTTANFTDEGDGLRKAISGVQGADRATLNFPASFKADYAIAFDQGFGGVWELVANGAHNYINSVNLSPTGTKTSPTYSFTLAKSDVGNPPGFRFLVTYVSESGYRSNEFIGDAGPESNPQNNPYTASSTVSFGSPLPIGFSNVTARLSEDAVQISWSVTDEETGGIFKVERSGNGTDFSVIGTATPDRLAYYSFKDNDPFNGNNYYRIAFQSAIGKISYSNTVTTYVHTPESLRAYWSGSDLRISVNTKKYGDYTIRLINSAGQVIARKKVSLDGTQNSFELSPNSLLRPGIYTISVRGNGEAMTTRIMRK